MACFRRHPADVCNISPAADALCHNFQQRQLVIADEVAGEAKDETRSKRLLTQLRQQFVKSFFSGVRFRVHWFWHRVQSCKLDVVKTKPFFNPGNLMACICGDVIEPGTASDTRTGRWLNRCVPRGGRGSRLWPIWGRWMRQAGWGWWMRRVAVLSRRRGSCLSCLQPGDGWRWITSGFGWRTAGRLGVTGWGCSWWIGWGLAVSCRG